MKTDIIHKELDLIQEVIKRMAHNSFLLKGWLITILSVILALTKDEVLDPNEVYLYLVLLLPILSFWYLDGFFLHTERSYRKIYQWVIKNRPTSDKYLYDLNPNRFRSEIDSIWKVMGSRTLLVFYGIPFGFIVGLLLYRLFAG